jgi:hypothetical protein
LRRKGKKFLLWISLNRGDIIEAETSQECIRKERDLVNTYDQYVDVVSCWEAFFDLNYKKKYEKSFFDRFPKIPLPDDGSLTPDFTIFFTKEYAMIFEISRTFPKGEVKLRKEMNQLFAYDNNIPVYNGETHVNVDNYDIILVLSGLDSLEITNRIKKYMEEENKVFNHNFIVLEYNLNFMDRSPHYYFRKIPIIESSLTDFFSDSFNLSEQLDKNLRSLKMKIEDMKEYKINGVLCNDCPPPAYLAGFLWHKIFYRYLNKEDKKLWREKNPRLIIPLEVDIDDLKLKVEKFIKNGRIRRRWIEDVLKFLISCGLAERNSSNTYLIKYRNLYPTIRTEYKHEFLLEKEFQKELSRYFIERFCSKKFGHPITKEETRIQTRLNNY